MGALRYIWRSVKFLASLLVLYTLAMWIMQMLGASALEPADMVRVLLLTWRGRILVAAVAVWAAVYPKVGFVVRRAECDMTADREMIENAFIRSGYVLVRDDGGRLHFRAANVFKRLRLLFEDEITVHQEGSETVLEGIRRSVAEVEMRLNTYIRNSKRGEE